MKAVQPCNSPEGRQRKDDDRTKVRDRHGKLVHRWEADYSLTEIREMMRQRLATDGEVLGCAQVAVAAAEMSGRTVEDMQEELLGLYCVALVAVVGKSKGKVLAAARGSSRDAVAAEPTAMEMTVEEVERVWADEARLLEGVLMRLYMEASIKLGLGMRVGFEALNERVRREFLLLPPTVDDAPTPIT